MSSKLGVYYAPMHDRPQDWDYMRRLQPPVVRILLSGADAQRVVQVHQAASQARISLRWWDIDDGGEGNKRSKLNNPEASGAGDAVEVLRRVEQMEMVARGNGWVFPPREKIIANTLNEPPIWEAGVREQTVAYCIAFLAGLHPHRIPVATGCINTGHPSEWPPHWAWFQPVIDAMIWSPLNMLELHSYWQLEGPNHVWTDEQGNQRKDWGALAGRYMHCPYGVPILIGECGADGRLYGRKADHTGWQGNISATQYAQQLRWYHEQIQKDERIVAMLPFLTDYQNREWASFDTMPAREEILSIAVHVPEPQPTQPIEPPPPVISPGPTEPPEPQPTGILDPRVMAAIFEVESGRGFDEQNKLIIRFEPHIFRARINDEQWFNQHFQKGLGRAWENWTWRPSSTAAWQPVHQDNASQHQVLQFAARRNQDAAYQSISMGIGQVMGFHYADLGYPSAKAMFDRFSASGTGLGLQVVGVVNFILARPELVSAIRAKDFWRIARIYNGNNAGVYAPLLQAAYERLT